MNVLQKFMTYLACTVAATAAVATEGSISSVLNQYQQICKDDYNSELQISEDAVYELLAGRELTKTVVVVDTSGLMCGKKPLGFCGSGGCQLVLLIDDKMYIERGWSPVNIQYNGHYLILIPLSGGMCGNISNGSPCFKVLAWDELEQELNSPN